MVTRLLPHSGAAIIAVFRASSALFHPTRTVHYSAPGRQRRQNDDRGDYLNIFFIFFETKQKHTLQHFPRHMTQQAQAKISCPAQVILHSTFQDDALFSSYSPLTISIIGCFRNCLLPDSSPRIHRNSSITIRSNHSQPRIPI